MLKSVLNELKDKQLTNKRNPHKDLPPFLTRQKQEIFTLLRVAAISYFSTF
jgi:hypothetical protein